MIHMIKIFNNKLKNNFSTDNFNEHCKVSKKGHFLK